MSAENIEAILDDNELLREATATLEVTFQLKDIKTPITVKLFRPVKSDAVYYWQSHLIKTPLQKDAFHGDGRFIARYETFEDALTGAISALTQYYEAAVAENLTPDELWLVANDSTAEDYFKDL